MPRRIEFDSAKVERVASQHLSRAESAAALGLSLGSFDSQKYKKGLFTEAWERGLAASDGGSPLPQPAVELDQPTQKVLDEIKDCDGCTPEDLEVSLRPLAPGAIARSVTVLVRNGLAESREGRLYAVAQKVTGRKPRAAAGTKQKRASASSSKRHASTTDQENSESGDAKKMWEDLPTNNDHALNGHTAEIAATLEMARVELLYQRVHREASPKVGDVIDRVESGLETLVKAKAAGA